MDMYANFLLIIIFFDASNITNIHKYLTKKYDTKQYLELLKIFIVLLASLVNASTHTKFVSLSNQTFQIQPTLIDINSNQYNQELNCNPFVIKLEKCAGSCNTINNLSNRVFVSNTTEY